MVEHLHGKEGVDGSSPSEGFDRKSLQIKMQCCLGLTRKVASPLVVFERDEVSFVAGSLLLGEASETATAGPQGP